MWNRLSRFIAGCIVLFLIGLPGAYAEEKQDLPVPDPHKLASDWWQYFQEADGSSIDQKVAGFTPLLNGLEKSEADNQAVQRIRLLLGLYAKILKSELKLVPQPVLKESYQLADILEFLARQAALVEEQELRKERIAQESELLQKDREELNRKKLAYLGTLNKGTPLLGDALEIIADRLEIEIREVRLDKQKKQQDRLQENIAWYENNLEAAYQKITIDPKQIAELEKRRHALLQQFDAARKIHEQARNQLLLFENDATPLAEAEENLLKQKQLLADSRAQSLALQVSDIELLIQLVRLEKEKKAFDRKSARELIKTSLTQVDAAKKWGNSARRLLTRDIDATSMLAEEDATSAPLRKLAAQRVETTIQTEKVIDEMSASLRAITIKAELLDRRLRAVFGTADDLRAQTVGAFTDTLGYIDDFFAKTLFEVNETPVTSYSLIRFLVIMFIAWAVSFFLKNFLARIGARYRTMSDSALFTVARVLSIVVIVVGFLIALTSIGIDVTKFALIASALSIGIGFGLQNMINNFVSGIILLFERSLKVGDFVELESGVTGEVQAINVRSTIVKTNDHVDIIVPNSEFVSGRMTNWTMQKPYLRIHIPFGVAYGSDKELVRKVVQEAADNQPHTLLGKTHKTQVWLTGFGDSSLDFELVVWLKPAAVKRPGAVRSDYNWAIETALGSHHIEIPFPQRDLHVRSGTIRTEAVLTETPA